jgi:hypothetical protein
VQRRRECQQSPLKDQAFSSFLDQNQPFELRRKQAFRFQSFHEIHLRSSKYWPNPSISVGGGQQGCLAFALRRQRSHVRIVSGAPVFRCFTARYARLDRNSSSVSFARVSKSEEIVA